MGMNINNVSMDYFLRGVDAAKPKDASSFAKAPEDKQPNAGQRADDPGAKTGKLVAQLDVLLLKAAKESTNSVDGKTVKKVFQQLVDCGAISRDSLKLLEQTATTAAKTLKALDKFTGQQLASAFDARGDFNAATKPGKAVKAAVEAQQTLADLLAQLGKRLDALDRHKDEVRANVPEFNGVRADVRDKVEEMRAICDRRATEIVNLAYQMKDFATHLAAHRQNADPNVVAILKAKVDELLPRQALAMHGTADALASVDEGVTARLRPVAEKIEAFRSSPSGAITAAKLAELQSDVHTMKSAIADIRENGVARNEAGDSMAVAKDIVEALEKEVAKVEALFKTARRDVARKICENHIETAKSLICTDTASEQKFAGKRPQFRLLREMRDKLLESMAAYMDAALAMYDAPSQELADKMNAAANSLRQRAQAVRDAAANIPSSKSPDEREMQMLVESCFNVKPMVSSFLSSGMKLCRGDRFFTGAEALAVFEGKISASSLVEARARGLGDADVDPANEDANIVSERRLGAGSAGTVYELQRSDGTSVVFKGEAESRTGLAHLAAGDGQNYEECQQTVNLNFATRKAAETLGMGDLVVGYSAGAHKGVFGFYMEKAKGMSARSFEKGLSSPSPDAGLSADQIRSLPAAQKQRVKADLMRQLNRLQWLDLLTGQNDRHGSNYFVHVDPKTLKVTVKGIDNDACYSQMRIGATRFGFDESSSMNFRKVLRKIAEGVDKGNVEAECEQMLKDPGIGKDKKGNYIVDAAKIKNKAVVFALMKVRGAVSVALPDKIDRETYNALIALKSGPARKAYLDMLMQRVSKGCCIAATSRLNDLIAHAEKLARENKVLDAADWLKAQDVPLASGDLPYRRLNGSMVEIGGDVAKRVNRGVCPSYFTRDGLDKLFPA